MGLRIIVPGADYSTLPSIDGDALAYFNASGITSDATLIALSTFIKGLKSNNIWGKVDYMAPILGSTIDQVKYNLKNLNESPMKTLTDGLPTNTINKGIVLANSKAIKISQNETLVNSIANGSGHAMYFINEAQTANGVILSSTQTASIQYFYVTGNLTSKHAGVFQEKSFAPLLAPAYTAKGCFGIVKNDKAYQYIGNKVLLDGLTRDNTGAFAYTGNITIGDDKFSSPNTVSFVSLGAYPMSADEMIVYQGLVNTLMASVHGIVV
jgi:hypothetical protein